MRIALLAFAFLGLLLFGTGLAVSFADPLQVERGARELVRLEVERRVGAQVDRLSNSRIAASASRALGQLDIDVQRLREAVRSELPARVAQAAGAMLDPACECRQRWAERRRDWQAVQLTTLQQLRARLVQSIEHAYADVATALLREFRIVTASNAAAFLLLAVATLRRGQSTRQLLLPALALAGAVAVVGGLYLLQQNWLHTLVFNDYVGWAYAACLAVVALLLLDVLLNRARVTTRIVNTVLNLAGSPLVLSPC